MVAVHGQAECCETNDRRVGSAPNGRARLAGLDPHMHCSVIGTCLTTAELRKIMARFVDIQDASDVEVHHEAVRLTAEEGALAKALHKALDQRHSPVVQRFAQVHDEKGLAALWKQALQQGEIPGAYWAVLTHRAATPDLRKTVFGDVHMLSHLVGAANRADIRRLVALEASNAELRARLDQEQCRAQALVQERVELDNDLAEVREQLRSAEGQLACTRQTSFGASAADTNVLVEAIALQTERRERAEQSAAAAWSEQARLQQELDRSREHSLALHRELAAAEAELGGEGDPVESPGVLDRRLRGQRVFYVGGRPSSSTAIRALAVRHGAEFQRHDGGLEDRKGLLAAGVSWATVVAFPVDCIDHDSATNIKRLCARQGVAFCVLRSASVTSFAAALSRPRDDLPAAAPPICLRHG
jgi:hypothetical protein